MLYPARRTTYNGIAMRSRLEADVARWLDEEGQTWTYEPQAFANRDETYLPDFQLLDKPRPTFLEVKGTFADAERAMARMEVIWSSIPDAVLLIVFGNHSQGLVSEGRRWEMRPMATLGHVGG